MRRFMLAIAAIGVGGFVVGAAANPIPESSIISEAQINDSAHWSIELGGTGLPSAIFYIHPPCTTTLLRLRITSSGNVYTAKCYFNTNHISVLTRASITGIPQTEKVVIQAHDTIQILDTAWHSISNNLWHSWMFVVRPVKNGNSLVSVNYSMWAHPFETTRPSIGSLGNYTTVYTIYLMDSLNNTLPNVWIYEPCNSFILGATVTQLKTELVSTKIYSETVSLGIGNNQLACSCDSLPIYSGNIVEILFPPSSTTEWIGQYNDTLYSITDTIILPCPRADIKTTQPINHIPNIRFSALPGSGRGITFVVAASYQISGATVRIFTVTGRELVSLKVPAIDATGTYSLTWDGTKENRNSVPAGTYICKLLVDGKTAASQTVTIR